MSTLTVTIDEFKEIATAIQDYRGSHFTVLKGRIEGSLAYRFQVALAAAFPDLIVEKREQEGEYMLIEFTTFHRWQQKHHMDQYFHNTTFYSKSRW